jgi:hypothetical protein
MPHQVAWLYQAVVAGEEVTLAINKGGKDHVFLAASNSLEMMTNCTRCVHVNAELGSRFHVWT